MGTRLHLVIDDDVATAYNQAQDAFFEAQKHHKKTTGQDWTGREPLSIDWTPEQQRVWNAMADVINKLVELNGGGIDIPQEECTSDYLVKL